MMRPSLFAPLAALVLLGGCISFGPKVPPTLLDLTAENPVPAGAGQSGSLASALVVEVPEAALELNVTRVAVQIALATLVPTATAAAPAVGRILYATQPGKPAFDGDDFGGNPFATAFVEALAAGEGDDRESLIERTLASSSGEQRPDLEVAAGTLDLAPRGRAVALVMVFADYGGSQGLGSLPGAAFDAARVHRAARRAGYDARFAVVASREEYLARLARFSRKSGGADRALLYTTGHGMEVGGVTWLIPPEFDPEALEASWPERALRVAGLGDALRARKSNLVVYAGCRDNPLGLE
ncbi:MAG: caspase family protein [Novosphingobium sp.]|nr:caspase family protein [Novosphingobium sp.]